jgi:cytidylate kinase
MPATIAITIARQLGAGGAPLGKRLAQKLDFAYYDDEILRLAAEKLGAPPQELARWDEHRAAFWERLGNTFTVGVPESLYVPLQAVPVVQDREVFELQAEVIRDAASKGNCIIIGRAGFWILRDHPGRLSIYLHSPAATRVPVIMETFKVTAEKARELIARIDADRARFVRETTGKEIGASCQHICLDTSVVSLDAAERIVTLAVQELSARLQR